MLIKEINLLVLKLQELIPQEKHQPQEATQAAKEKYQVREEMAEDKEKCRAKEATHKEVTMAQKETEEVRFYI